MVRSPPEATRTGLRRARTRAAPCAARLRWAPRAPRAALLVALLAAVACRSEPRGGASTSASAPTSRAPRPERRVADAAELAVVAPIAPGSRLAGYEVVRVEGAERGAMRVVCAKGRGVVRLDVALRADAGAEPAATAGPYAIFWGAHNAPLDEAEAVARALAEVVKRNAAAPTPSSLGPWAPPPPSRAL